MARSQLILDRYRVLEQAGFGGYGTVQHAFDTHLKRDVAIKCIALSEDEVARARLVALEARMAADLEEVEDTSSASVSFPDMPSSEFPSDPDFLRAREGRRSNGASAASRSRSGGGAKGSTWEEEDDDWEDSMVPWGAATTNFSSKRAGDGAKASSGRAASPRADVQGGAARMADVIDETDVDVRHLRGIRASRTIDGATERRRRRGGMVGDREEASRAGGAWAQDAADLDDSDFFEHIPGLQEARSVAKLSDSNIVTVYDCAVEGSTAYIIMEYVQGKTLAQIIDELDDQITLDVIAAVFAGVSHGLEAAHSESTLHLDIKPENVIVNAKGVPKVMDFGLAALMDATGSGTTGGGTIGYMPLEQMRRQPLDVRTDEWALASLTYEMLTGSNPFFADTLADAEEAIEEAELVYPSLCWDELDEAADDIVFAALDPDMNERYDSVAEFSEALLPLLGNPKNGKKVLIDVVAGVIEDDTELYEPPKPHVPGPPLVDRMGLHGAEVLGRLAATATVALLAAVGMMNLHLVPGSELGLFTDSIAAFWIIVVVSAGVTAVFPTIGVLFGYGALAVGLAASNAWALTAVVVLVTVGWWYLVGRRGTAQVCAALLQVLCGSVGFSAAAPVACGVLLPVIQSALTAAFAFVTALIMASCGSMSLMNWDVMLHFSFNADPQFACMTLMGEPGTWLIGVSWVAAAALYSLFCVRGTKAFDVAGSVVAAAVLVFGVCAAAHFTNFNGAWLPEAAPLLGALVPGVAGILAAAMNLPDRARWAEEEWYVEEEE